MKKNTIKAKSDLSVSVINEVVVDKTSFEILASDQKDGQSNISHEKILHELLKDLEPIDFLTLVNPNAQTLLDDYHRLSKSPTLQINEVEDSAAKEKRENALLKVTKAIIAEEKKIKQRHYVVCITTELLKRSHEKKWNLCKFNDYVYVYNGAYWKQLSKDDMKSFLGKVAIRLGCEVIDAEHHSFKEELLKQFLTQSHIPALLRKAEKTLINLSNGTFEFDGDKGKLRQFDSNDFLTYQLPFCYDPEATCPLFKKYLDKVLPESQSQTILQEFSGYIFSNKNLEKCLFLLGSGSNGKSVFFNILRSLLGKENILTYDMGFFNHEYNRAKLTDVLVNYSSEKGADVKIEIFKALISGEPLQAREIYSKPFTLDNKVKFIINSNELPVQIESTQAYFRRFLIVPFDVTITEEETDINLADNIISQELPGVFNWLLQGLENLLANEQFTQSPKVQKALEDFKLDSDTCGLFIADYKIAIAPGTKVSLADLYSRYKTFCNDENKRAVGKNKFSKRLKKEKFEDIRLSDGSTGFLIKG